MPSSTAICRASSSLDCVASYRYGRPAACAVCLACCNSRSGNCGAKRVEGAGSDTLPIQPAAHTARRTDRQIAAEDETIKTRNNARDLGRVLLQEGMVLRQKGVDDGHPLAKGALGTPRASYHAAMLNCTRVSSCLVAALLR